MSHHSIKHIGYLLASFSSFFGMLERHTAVFFLYIAFFSFSFFVMKKRQLGTYCDSTPEFFHLNQHLVPPCWSPCNERGNLGSASYVSLPPVLPFANYTRFIDVSIPCEILPPIHTCRTYTLFTFIVIQPEKY